MSRKTQDLFFGLTGQSLILDCPDGHPDSVTSVTVFQSAADDTSQPEFTAAGTVDASGAALSGSAGAAQADPTAIPVVSTTEVTVGRRYLLTSSLGHREWAEVVDIDTLQVISKYPLLGDYAAADTMVSTRVTAPVDATWIANLNKLSPAGSANPAYRVKWVLVVGGVTKTYETDVDIVRYEGRHHVTPLDIAERYSNWLDWLPPDSRSKQGQDKIDEAYRLLIGDLYADSVPDQLLRNGEAVDALVIERTLMLMGQENIYRQRYDQFIRSGAPIATDETGAGGASVVANRSPLWSR